ncbi:hypothetical protein UFOVP699_132 [uncultured Caudovirales phage]|uniref:Uncharacterized protein n=1 Tax=uncultured Caudovirales phage TaxID=2100421 RepID=A0A6J5NNU2_9CAUD|nr:hypothetical protein UFOVP699_132 [uncultured Caudovirales phage]
MKHILTYDQLLLESENTFEYRPLLKLLQCRFTSDRKHVMFEGTCYSCETGEISPLNEEWSWSDILHAGADVLSAGLDFVVPGSGAIVDTLNALSYIIEAQFADEDKRGSLYLMAAITYAFVIIPGPIQVASIPLKAFIKSGAKIASKAAKGALSLVAKFMPTILKEIPKRIISALKSPLGKGILGKFAGRIANAVKSFSEGAMKAFNKIMGRPDIVKKAIVKTSAKEAMSSSMITALKKFFSRSAKAEVKLAPKVSEKMMKKLGFVTNKPYRYINPKTGKGVTAKIVGTSMDGQQLMVKFGNKASLAPAYVPVNTFVKNTIGAPWGRRGYSVAAPLFVKRFASTLNDDGEVDPALLDELEAIDPNTTSAESLSFVPEEEIEYVGGENEI